MWIESYLWPHVCDLFNSSEIPYVLVWSPVWWRIFSFEVPSSQKTPALLSYTELWIQILGSCGFKIMLAVSRLTFLSGVWHLGMFSWAYTCSAALFLPRVVHSCAGDTNHRLGCIGERLVSWDERLSQSTWRRDPQSLGSAEKVLSHRQWQLHVSAVCSQTTHRRAAALERGTWSLRSPRTQLQITGCSAAAFCFVFPFY